MFQIINNFIKYHNSTSNKYKEYNVIYIRFGFKAAGWVLAISALIQVPIWGSYVVYKQKRGSTFLEVPTCHLSIWNFLIIECPLQRLRNSFTATDDWGPKDPQRRAAWLIFKQETPEHTWIPKWLKKILKSESHTIKSCRNISSQSSLAIIHVDDNPLGSVKQIQFGNGRNNTIGPI